MSVSYNAFMTAESTRPRSAGRPREFDVDTALDHAARVFRQRGYHATSISDLGAAMQLTAGSIYKAFTDKRAVFMATLDRYSGQRRRLMASQLAAEPTGREKIRAMLQFYADAAHGEEGRDGCLVVGSVVELSTFDPELAAHVTGLLQQTQDLLQALVEAGMADGSIAADTDPHAVTLTLLSVLEGLRVLGKCGRSRAEMLSAADAAMAMLRPAARQDR
ncbi:TetR/AcrR family transcriptional regulator [Silvimonas iriomotensis]|uniref:TetR family transcriptional regulator n=1 Tax=Silvimonas iriomotensis TaxID=449662 RepID=A0ABQ2PAL5_9NEIS|nr:TetR/AcrR family transcriptional regulator [Silvimonas iriomotensis]GGP22365.1 TetR family transcriptional regulator [Silvimonas iriomotensis]